MLVAEHRSSCIKRWVIFFFFFPQVLQDGVRASRPGNVSLGSDSPGPQSSGSGVVTWLRNPKLVRMLQPQTSEGCMSVIALSVGDLSAPHPTG